MTLVLAGTAVGSTAKASPAVTPPPIAGSTESWEAPEFGGTESDQPRRVYHLVLSQWRTNTYVLCGRSGQAIVIDPADWLAPLPNGRWELTGQDSKRLLALIRSHHLKVRYIISTHGHLDHVSGATVLKDAFPKAIFALGAGDIDARERPKDSHFFPVPLPKVGLALRDGAAIHCDGILLKVIATPGHSPGSICLRCGNWLFSGDTLFYHTIGRTNFHDGSGNGREEIHSIRTRLYNLPPATLVLPGHSLFTSIREEIVNNPWTQPGAPDLTSWTISTSRSGRMLQTP